MTAERTPAVVIGLDSMQGIQTARILRRHRIPVIAVAADRSHPACQTNTCREIHFAGPAEDDLAAKLAEIGRSSTDRPVLVPCQDRSVRTVSRHRGQLSAWFRFALPPAHVVELMMDKISFFEHAQQHGLPVPKTFVLRERADAERAVAELPFPCLLKPAYRSQAWDRQTKLKVFKVESAEELLTLYDRCHSWAEALIAQQWVAGDDSCLYSCNAYFDREGRPLATFVARKLRQWPPEAGSSCLGEEVRCDFVRDTTLALFGSVPYRGLAYLEIKKDTSTGDFFIIEPNIGRPTGRSAIAEAGGVEMLHTMYCDILGLPLPEHRTQQYRGTKWIDLRHDFQSAFRYWRRGELTLWQWGRSWWGRKAHTLFSWRDPRPFLADLKKACGMVLQRRRAQRARRAVRSDLVGHGSVADAD